MRAAESALSQQTSVAAEFDRQVIEALQHAHETTVEGARLLGELDAQVEHAVRMWNLSTPAGAREFQRFLIGKMRQIVAVVQDTNDDDASKQALATAWTALYSSLPDPDEASQDDRKPAAATHEAGDPDAVPGEDDSFVLTGSPDSELDPYPDDFADDARIWDSPPPFGASTAQGGVPPASPMPAGFGGGVPGLGGMPAGGASSGYPQTEAPTGLLGRPSRDRFDDDELLFPDEDETTPDEPLEEVTDDDTAVADEAGSDTDPTSVPLPDGETITAATPQLAAAMRAALGGTAIAEAFRQQGIAIPPPGTAVTSPIEPTLLNPGDVGMFLDRHALALGKDKALLDGQIQHVYNLRGPSFLGWQHPSELTETAVPTPKSAPTPTRPAASVSV